MKPYTTAQRLAYSLKEIADFTGLSMPFLRNEVRAGRLRVRKFGRRVLVLDDDLQDYLATGSPGNKSEKNEASSL